jgi:translocation and assembly module TamB
MARIPARVFLALLALIALLAVAVFAIDTGPGRGVVARTIAGLRPANGLRYAVGRIDGSIYGKMTLHDLFVSDRKGVVATIPTVEIDWHPGSLLRNKVAADRVEAGLVTVLRRPEIVPTPGPLLPDIDIFIGRFAVRQIVLEAPVTARREVIALSGSADIASGRAKVTTDVTASGGDRLRLKLDVVPSADRFVIDAHLAAPPGGVVDGITRLGKPLAVDIGGAGTWQTWNGKATATLGGSPLLDLGLAAKAGRFTATGIARPGLASPSAARLTDPGLTIAASASQQSRSRRSTPTSACPRPRSSLPRAASSTSARGGTIACESIRGCSNLARPSPG